MSVRQKHALALGASRLLGTSTPAALRTTAKAGVNAATAAVAIPALVQTGDLMVVTTSGYSGGPPTTCLSSGGGGGGTWTQLVAPMISTGGGGFGVSFGAWYRFATAADVGSTVTVTHSVSEQSTIILRAYSGAGTPGTAATASTGASGVGTFNTPTVTSIANNSLIVHMWACETNNNGLQAITSVDAALASTIQVGGGNLYNSGAIGEETQVAAGASTARSASGADSTSDWIGAAVAVPPA